MAKWKRNNYKFWHSPIALVVLFCLFLLFGYNVINLIEKERDTVSKKELILEKIDNLKERETSLSSSISKLETEEGIEEIIREKYQVAKSGEKMVIIVDEDRKDLQIEVKTNTNGFKEWFSNIFKK